MSDKRIFLVLLEDLPCPGSHYLHTRKFLEAFGTLGYEYGEIKVESDIQSIGSDDIVYISNHGVSREPNVLDLIQKIGERGAKYILWFWHELLDIAEAYFSSRYI